MPPEDSYLYPYILSKRAKLKPSVRAKSAKMGRKVVWNFPYLEEVQFRRLVKAALTIYVTIPMLEAAERGYERSLRADSEDGLHLDDLNDLKGIITRIALLAFPNSNFLNRIARSISRQSRKQWSKFIKQATGVDITMFETESEREFAAEWAEDNIDRLKKYAKLHAKKINDIVATGVAEDKSWFSIKKEILRANARVTAHQAAYIARDATGNLSSGLQEALSKEAGIEAYIWDTRRDRKVRGTPWGLYPKTKYSHYKMKGVLRRWSDGKISTDGGKTWRRVRGREEPEHVGRAPNCRCTGEPSFLPLVKAVDKEINREEKSRKSLLERLGERGPRSKFSEWSDW